MLQHLSKEGLLNPNLSLKNPNLGFASVLVHLKFYNYPERKVTEMTLSNCFNLKIQGSEVETHFNWTFSISNSNLVCLYHIPHQILLKFITHFYNEKIILNRQYCKLYFKKIRLPCYGLKSRIN